jgi:hypothetical protein
MNLMMRKIRRRVRQLGHVTMLGGKDLFQANQNPSAEFPSFRVQAKNLTG